MRLVRLNFYDMKARYIVYDLPKSIIEDELEELFMTAPELSAAANPMFDDDTWKDVWAYVEIYHEGYGMDTTTVVEYTGTIKGCSRTVA